MAAQLMPGFSTWRRAQREFHEFIVPISSVDSVVLYGIQQVMVECSQEVFPTAEK
jgi:hypothetical protein